MIKVKQYCIRRGSGSAKKCNITTYAKSGICSMCQYELQELCNDIDMIKKLKLNKNYE